MKIVASKIEIVALRDGYCERCEKRRFFWEILYDIFNPTGKD
jgi:hypothetical protein